jgi:hypothetical protein
VHGTASSLSLGCSAPQPAQHRAFEVWFNPIYSISNLVGVFQSSQGFFLPRVKYCTLTAKSVLSAQCAVSGMGSRSEAVRRRVSSSRPDHPGRRGPRLIHSDHLATCKRARHNFLSGIGRSGQHGGSPPPQRGTPSGVADPNGTACLRTAAGREATDGNSTARCVRSRSRSAARISGRRRNRVDRHPGTPVCIRGAYDDSAAVGARPRRA